MPPRAPSASSADLTRESQPPVLRASTPAPASAGPSSRDREPFDDGAEVSRGTPPPVSSTRRSLFPPGAVASGPLAPTRLWLELPKRRRAFLLGVGGAGVLAVLVLLLAGLWGKEQSSTEVRAEARSTARAAAAPIPVPPGPIVTPAPEPSVIPLEALELEKPASSATRPEDGPDAQAKARGKERTTAPRPKPKPADSTPDYGI